MRNGLDAVLFNPLIFALSYIYGLAWEELTNFADKYIKIKQKYRYNY